MFELQYSNQSMGSVFAGSTNLIKSRSGTSGMGYSTKNDIWGVALASLLIACIKRYIHKTGETTHVIDETRFASVYSSVCGFLHERIKLSELPAIQSPTARFMAKVMYRTPISKEVPLSDAKT